MRVPVEWLGEYVSLPTDVTGEHVAAQLVRVGLEEEGIFGSEVTGPLVVGRVLELVKEPQKNGKVINWCQVDVGDANGTGEPQGIICGAHNFEVDDLVAVILPGGVLPGNFQIGARKTYGHVSAGMICSAKELGLGQEHDGIIVLTQHLGPQAADLVPGTDLRSTLGLDREVVEVNVTPDRGYCFSMRGIAREYGHATGANYTDPAKLSVDEADKSGFAVELNDDAPINGVQGCDRYLARIVRGLDLTRSTPAWMATRLTEAGMRPISLAVDVTNYVMLALGQPLHAFDLDSLRGPIVVRRAAAGEKLRTLDDVDRALGAEDLLITDGGDDSILALAGVMGGASSEVSPTTADVLIEAAHFDQRSVARSARRHKLSTEASKRFERGVDPDVTAAAAQLALNLLVELGGGTVDPEITDVDNRVAREPFDFTLRQASDLVGVEYADSKVIEILQAVGCEVSGDGPVISVLPASWRPDLTDGPTLVEEVARIDGYDNIPSLVPAAPGGRGLTASQRARRTVANTLAAAGLVEVLTYPFVGESVLNDLGLAKDDERRNMVQLANPLSEESPWMRTELLQTLPETLRRNIARGSRDVAIFEMDTITQARIGAQAPVPGVGERPSDEVLGQIHAAVPAQPWHVAMAAAGDLDRAGWWGDGRAAEANDAASWVRLVAEALNVDITASMTERAPWHPGRCVEFATLDGNIVGWAGELHPKVIQRLGLPERSVAAEVDLQVLLDQGLSISQASPISTHPVAMSDVALVVDRTVPHAHVEESLRQGAGEDLESIALFDVYRGEHVADSEQSLAFRLTFRASDRTLRTEEVNAARDGAVKQAAADHGAIQR